MENLVPLGTGNSRLMKSNIPASTTLAQLIQMWNNGTFPYDIGPLNSAGISQQGTPLNKDTLLKDSTAALYGLTNTAVPDDVLNILSNAIMVSNAIGLAPVGTVIKLNVSGVPTDFIVVHQGNPNPDLYDASCDGTWILAKNSYAERQWNTSTSNNYENSDINSYLNNTFFNLLDADIQAAIKQVRIPYVNGTGGSAVASGANGLLCKIFNLGGYEVGFSTSDNPGIPVDGSKLDYFLSGIGQDARERRMADDDYWTRSNVGTNGAWRVMDDGNCGQFTVTATYGVRPALILPSDFRMAGFAGGVSDVQGNPITIGVQIATGSYVGTGTYGASNPNTLTFSFTPKIIWVYGYYNAITNTETTLVGDNYPLYIVTFDNVPNVYTKGYGLRSNSSNGSDCYGKKDSNTYYWYNTTSESNQLNNSNWAYHYIAIG